MAIPFRALLPAAALLGAASLSAQEPWEPCFRLTAFRAAGAEDARLGKDTGGALSVAGAYPVLRRGRVLFEAGYRRLLDLERGGAPGYRSLDRLDGYFLGTSYRHLLPLEGLYAQAGLRYGLHRAFHRDIVLGAGPGGKDLWVDQRGRERGALEPSLALGARFTARNSVELGWGRVKLEDAFGASRSQGLLEFSVVVHL